MVVAFELDGQTFTALNVGPVFELDEEVGEGPQNEVITPPMNS